MLNKEFCIPLENLVEELAQPMSTADIAELTIQLQIGKTVKEARKAKHLTQTAFAKVMGVTQSMVSRWESGDCNFTLHTLISIGEVLGLSIRNPLTPSNSLKCTKIDVGFRSFKSKPIPDNISDSTIEVAA